MRRPLFGRHGPTIVAALCGYELAALTSRRLPTITALVRRRPTFGLVLVGMLAHHWFLEQTTIDPER